MLINKEHWRPETLVAGLAKISTRQVHSAVQTTIVGIAMASLGLLSAVPTIRASSDHVFWSLLMMGIGGFAFTLSFLFSIIICLAKELQKTKERFEELTKKLDESTRENS